MNPSKLSRHIYPQLSLQTLQVLLQCLKHNFRSPVLAMLLNCYGYVLCLIIIAGDYRRLLLTVTGFTLAHSVTLSLATLNIFRLPSELVERLIALSILLLAKEIIKRTRAGTGVQDKIAWRHPVSASSVFRLSHGLSLTVVLQELGLPI